MSRILKTSGFLGLATMMSVGLYQEYLLMNGTTPPGWLVGGHAHLGVLSILAVVMGFAVDAFGLAGRLRSAVTGMYVVGQWALPLTVWAAMGLGLMPLLATGFLWGGLLLLSMLLMAYQAATTDVSLGESGPRAGAPADD